MKAVIDRFEEDKAVLLVGEDEDVKVVFPKEYLPEEAEEGDYLSVDISIDMEATEAARAEAEAILKELKGDNE
ncbi:MAG: DUF3006 domain-containing protein [Schwartzia succinivorans]|jgi:hypothetical protein|uniref:DUF3006 domain-containing protein n=1 Tax=Schwartzia succinivorans TaxID=55507 RepID=UPI00235420D4|nr:DUF3006 domain-containing protein [Schwartzia succinivorans]MBE6096972.1 DUF3006 domain-containing protein [Schwartzia succinivorans]